MTLSKDKDPFERFGEWFAEARDVEPLGGTPMSVATVDADGNPNVRIVLLKDWGQAGFTFYTNTDSQKGREIKSNMKAALCFHWSNLRRSVRIRGGVEFVSVAEADDYFSTRPLGSRIGAWASKQSEPLESRFALEKAVAKYGLKFNVGEVPRPENWTGFRIVADEIEFWVHRESRLHDRLLYTHDGDTWTNEWLYP